MRKLLILAALLIAAPVAQAAPLTVAGAPHLADTATHVETVACVRYGWRGAGVYPGCYRGPRYAMVAPYYVAPRVYAAPVYGPPRRCWYAGAWRPC